MNGREKRVSEKRITDVLVCHLRRMDIGCVSREIRHYEKSIDVASFGCEELCTIEVKIENWKKAFQQAFVNLAIADKSYIAMYSRYANRVDMQMLKKFGIGLYSVGASWGEVELLEEARTSQFTNKITNKRLKDQLSGAVK